MVDGHLSLEAAHAHRGNACTKKRSTFEVGYWYFAVRRCKAGAFLHQSPPFSCTTEARCPGQSPTAGLLAVLRLRWATAGLLALAGCAGRGYTR